MAKCLESLIKIPIEQNLTLAISGGIPLRKTALITLLLVPVNWYLVIF
jgi:hypothetical protein